MGIRAWKPLRGIGIIAMMMCGLLGTAVSPAVAVPVQYPVQPIAGWSTNGTVYASKIVGDVVYFGGSFSQVRGPGGSPTQSRSNVAAIDRVTGNILPFRADTDGVVRDVISDGTTVWIGGAFSTVNGTTRRRVAAVDSVSGQVRSGFSVNGSATAYGLGRLGNTLYVGGTFTTFGGTPRGRIVALNAQTGAVITAFQPNANAAVHDIDFSPDGSRVYVGGQFTQIGGAARAYIAALNPVSGAAVAPAFSQTGAMAFDITLDDAGTRLYAALGGGQNRVSAYNTTTGARQWFQTSMGDTQAVDYHGGNVYFGFHEGFAGDRSVRLLAADATTGALQNEYRPRIDSFFGVWSVDATARGLAVGGTFTMFEGVATRGIAVAPITNVDTQAPSVPAGLTVAGATPNAVTIAWNPSTDDLGPIHYEVFADDALAGTTSEPSFTLSGLAPGASIVVRVRARDGAGNVSAVSSPLTITTPRLLVPVGANWRYLDDGSNQGTVWRAVGFNDSSWASGPAELGFGDGDEQTVLTSGYRTYYFRHVIPVIGGLNGDALLRVRRDDGIVVYVNGVEVLRDNMPGGTITSNTLASSTIAGAAESAWVTATVPAAAFTAGTNVIAAEVHQVSLGSSDVTFDLELAAP